VSFGGFEVNRLCHHAIQEVGVQVELALLTFQPKESAVASREPQVPILDGAILYLGSIFHE
jgi:hypothetical protein